MSNTPTVSRWLALLALALTAVGCTDPLGPEKNKLDAAQDRWNLVNADNYVFEFQRLCFCASDFVRPVRIEVLDGKVNSAIYVDTGEPISLPLTSVLTIDGLLDEIRDATDGMAFSVIADYDADLGYPTSVSIDYIEHAIDDEMSFNVSSFQLIDA